MRTPSSGPQRVTQEDIARACKIDQGSVSRILNKDTRDSFAQETIRKVFKVARELGYLHPALVTTNRRESARRKSALHARIQIILGTHTVYDEGTAEVADISMSGMLLRSFKTRRQSLPLDRFKIDATLEGARIRPFTVRCRVVRLSETDSDFALAVKFEALDEDSRDRLKATLKG